MIVTVVITAVYEHRSIIKHAIDETKMRPGPKIEHYHMIAMLLKYCRPAVKVKTPAELQAQVGLPASLTLYNAFNSLLSGEQISNVPTPDNEILLQA